MSPNHQLAAIFCQNVCRQLLRTLKSLPIQEDWQSLWHNLLQISKHSLEITKYVSQGCVLVVLYIQSIKQTFFFSQFSHFIGKKCEKCLCRRFHWFDEDLNVHCTRSQVMSLDLTTYLQQSNPLCSQQTTSQFRRKLSNWEHKPKCSSLIFQ